MNVTLNHGMSLFHLYADDLERQRLKDIYLLTAGGLLMLGLGCTVALQ